MQSDPINTLIALSDELNSKEAMWYCYLLKNLDLNSHKKTKTVIHYAPILNDDTQWQVVMRIGPYEIRQAQIVKLKWRNYRGLESRIRYGRTLGGVML